MTNTLSKTAEAKRPVLKARYWIWKDRERNETPGIGLWDKSSQVKAHLTAAEARQLADKLHDMADHLEADTTTEKEIH